MRKLLVMLAVVVAMLGAGCEREITQTPEDAASVAEEFVTTLMVENDAEAGYEMIDSDVANQVTLSAFERAVTGSPGYGEVTSITATGYEMVAEQQTIDVYLMGDAGEVTYYYYVRVNGNDQEGYDPAAFLVHEEPFPETTQRQSL